MDGITYHYYTLSGKLMRQTWEDANGVDHVIDFCYDAAGKPFSMNYDGLILYYMLNLQGDVIRLISSEGVSYGIYQYDAWGNILYSTDNKWLNDNPLRYRGYIYDTESGLYYLQSRYYDPSIGRFINADCYASTGQGFLGYNMFAYCGNDPVSNEDPSGHAWWGTNTEAICDGGSGSVKDHGLRQACGIGYASEITEDGISINLDDNNDLINHLTNIYGLSMQEICDQIALSSCTRFNQLYGYEFILSDECVSNEIYDHVVAYQWSIGERFFPNLIGAGFWAKTGFSKDSVYQATRSTDIRIRDVRVSEDMFSQAAIFGYRDGIRDIYIGTALDPWANER